ncbi:MAG: hypothetical protein SD837_22000 [Candidatus Electrothrix scaldis]|nr:MAG: hypothetical protein SD837_22000 [Candidatus Electrothrix sp. GW3-3]
MKERKLLEIFDCLLAIKWKVNVAIAIISYVLLNWMATIETSLDLRNIDPFFSVYIALNGIGNIFKEIVPILFMILAMASFFSGKK